MVYSQPVIPAVGAVVIKGNEVLLIQRAKPPFKAHWSIPGGKIEHGEAAQEALLREVREETGIVAEILGLIDVFEALPETTEDPHYVMIDYACRYVSGGVVAGDDAMDAGFFPIEEALSRLAWDKTRHAIRRALPFFNGGAH